MKPRTNTINNFARRAAMTLLLAVMTVATAWAGSDPVINVEVCEGMGV